jgi:hypothetical protein
MFTPEGTFGAVIERLPCFRDYRTEPTSIGSNPSIDPRSGARDPN